MSAKMQEKKPCDGKELICINVDKVYDWIVKENSFDISPTGPIAFPGVTAATSLVGATVTCEVVPAPHRIQSLSFIAKIVHSALMEKTYAFNSLIFKRILLSQLFITLPNGATLQVRISRFLVVNKSPYVPL